jgi:hypothetical protein
MRRVGFTDRTRVADRKTTGDRVFSIDESVTGGSAHTRVRWIARHVRDDRTTHPERPPIASDAPHVISSGEAKNRKGDRRRPRSAIRARAEGEPKCGNAEAGHVRRPAAFGYSARRG